jgi:hypothetical protein
VPVTLLPQDFAIVHASGTGWWVLAEGAWIGYFPDSLWPAAANFTTAGVAEWFGEVSTHPGATPCSFMGDGIYGGLPGAALADNLGLYDTAFADFPASPNTVATTGGLYAAGAPFLNSFTFGGPGGGCP